MLSIDFTKTYGKIIFLNCKVKFHDKLGHIGLKNVRMHFSSYKIVEQSAKDNKRSVSNFWDVLNKSTSLILNIFYL